VSGITASSIDRPPYHTAGRASIEATGTVHARSLRAPQTTIAMATGSRTRRGTGTDAHVPLLPAATFRWTTSTHVRHWSGSITKETATIAALTPRAIARDRRSRRTADHSSPIPAVIFVRSTSDHVHGQRKPRTIAAARRSDTLPPAPSIAV